jgi:hypothetical protein
VDVRVHEAGQHDGSAGFDERAPVGHLFKLEDVFDAPAADMNRSRAVPFGSDDALASDAKVGRRHGEDLKHKSRAEGKLF